MHDVTPKVDKAQALNRSIRGLEVELATVRNARPAGDEVTPDEADAILEEQVRSYSTRRRAEVPHRSMNCRRRAQSSPRRKRPWPHCKLGSRS
jgi:hypothetical protein